jgi:hypothetical protein
MPALRRLEHIAEVCAASSLQRGDGAAPAEARGRHPPAAEIGERPSDLLFRLHNQDVSINDRKLWSASNARLTCEEMCRTYGALGLFEMRTQAFRLGLAECRAYGAGIRLCKPRPKKLVEVKHSGQRHRGAGGTLIGCCGARVVICNLRCGLGLRRRSWGCRHRSRVRGRE